MSIIAFMTLLSVYSDNSVFFPLQLTFQKAIDVLYQILGDPAGLPGAGCFEAAVLKELTEVI